MANADQRCYLVTGGASGIGLALVQCLLEQKRKVAVFDRDKDSLSEAAQTLDQYGDLVTFRRVDVSDETEVVSSIADIAHKFAPLAGAANSAGIARANTLLGTSLEEFNRTMAVNLTGSFLVCREAARHIMASGTSGAIVNIASVSGLRGSPNRTAYAASKGGVVNMTRAMAVELAPRGIRVNAVAPGPINTPLVQQVHTPDVRDMLTSVVPQARYGEPRDIATTCAFLLDDDASGYITGQIIAVDGGMTASAGWMS